MPSQTPSRPPDPPALTNAEGRAPPPPRISTPGLEGRDDIFFAAVETTRMPMVVTDPRLPDNPIIFANAAFIQMTGYDEHEIVRHNCRFLQGAHTDTDAVAKVRNAVLRREAVAVEILNYRKDGSPFWNALYIAPIFDQAGELIYFFASQLDVTRRREAEDGLRQAQKMEVVGQLTGGIAHDFNNMLLVIMGSLEQADVGDADKRRKRLDRALEGARRAQTLTSQLLAFARRQRLEGRPTRLSDLVDATYELLDRTLGSAVTIRREHAPGLWTAIVDPVQAETALLNILINARDAMPEGGDVTIRTYNARLSPAEAEAVAAAPGDYVVLSVTDAGHGMSPEVLSRVMEPFFTTKEVGKGTGMGLAQVYGFMRQSNGFVRLRSRVGEGATVELHFPAVDAAAQPLAAEVQGVRPRGGSESILMVEDNPHVLDTSELTLRESGYNVVATTSPQAALERLRGGEAFDLLFSDVVMPGGMNGVVLAREARRLRPDLKVLLTTGWAEHALDDAGPEPLEILAKPYRPDELLRRLRRMLDADTADGIS